MQKPFAKVKDYYWACQKLISPLVRAASPRVASITIDGTATLSVAFHPLAGIAIPATPSSTMAEQTDTGRRAGATPLATHTVWRTT